MAHPVRTVRQRLILLEAQPTAHPLERCADGFPSAEAVDLDLGGLVPMNRLLPGFAYGVQLQSTAGNGPSEQASESDRDSGSFLSARRDRDRSLGRRPTATYFQQGILVQGRWQLDSMVEHAEGVALRALSRAARVCAAELQSGCVRTDSCTRAPSFDKLLPVTRIAITTRGRFAFCAALRDQTKITQGRANTADMFFEDKHQKAFQIFIFQKRKVF